METRQFLPKVLFPHILLAAALITIEPLDGSSSISIREAPSGAVDIFKSDGSRVGYGVRRSDGSTDLFRSDGSRLGYTQPSPPREGPAPSRIFISPKGR